MTSRSIGRDAKRIKRDWTSSPDDDNNVALSAVIPDDLLATEILPRLADFRTALRSSAVSKLWHSLITADNFIPTFLRRRRPSFAMFVEFRFLMPNKHLRRLCPRYLIAEDSNVTAGVTSDYDISSSPCPGGGKLVFDSACDDFMLFSTVVTKANPQKHIFIRNIVTGQWLELPKVPVKEQAGFCALLSRPTESALSRYSFRVVFYNLITRDEIGPVQPCYTVFSPETGRWSDFAASPDIKRMPSAVAANGLLFFLFKDGPFRLLIFDAFGAEAWRFVDPPTDLLLPQQFYYGLDVEFGPPDEVEQLGSMKDRPVIGAVHGRLRLGQMFKLGSGGGGLFVIKIWELCDKCNNEAKNNNKTWRLVKEVKLRAPPPYLGETDTKWLYLLAFHPDDSDVVFLCCDSFVRRFRMSKCEYQKVFRLRCEHCTLEQSVMDSLPRFAQPFTVRLPPWPTTIPTIASSSDI